MTDVRDDLRGVARTLRRLAEWDREDGLIGYPSDSPERLASLVAQITRPPRAEPSEPAAQRPFVFTEGPDEAALVFVGEATGHEGDLAGGAFAGPAGELLDKMIAGMGLRRSDVVLLTLGLGRQAGHPAPSTSELAAIAADVLAQLARVKPAIIVSLGDVASRTLNGDAASLQDMRGHFHTLLLPSAHAVEVMPTLAPAHLLENPGDKRGVWEDLRRVMGALGLKGGIPRGDAS